MTFHGSPNNSEQWKSFLRSNSDVTAGLTRIHSVLSNAQRFEELLRKGTLTVSRSTSTLASLTNLEWGFFEAFMDEYRTEWQSYFDPMTYVAYSIERESRSWVPSAIPFLETDFAIRDLVIHYWADWNGVDPDMDRNLFLIRSRMRSKIAFRSLNIDRYKELPRDIFDGVLNIPFLAHFRFGKRVHQICGLRSPVELDETISEWVQ